MSELGFLITKKYCLPLNIRMEQVMQFLLGDKMK